MGGFARVTSIGVLQTTAAALQRFRGESAAVLDDLDIDVRRALEWIHHDRKDFWTKELRRCEENLTQARIQLQQAQSSRRIVGRESACIDEKRALDRAKHRLEIARQKVQAVQHWARAIDRAIDEFQSNRTQYATWLDTDLLKAVAALDRMSESLANYVSLEVPVDPSAVVLPGVAGGSHSERSEESPAGDEILRFAQHDKGRFQDDKKTFQDDKELRP
jgi:hypothetical protein